LERGTLFRRVREVISEPEKNCPREGKTQKKVKPHLEANQWRRTATSPPRPHEKRGKGRKKAHTGEIKDLAGTIGPKFAPERGDATE